MIKTFLAGAVACIFAAFVFVAGITWGLPRGEVNRYLFGDRPVWTGQQIITLAGGWDARSDVAADVDRDPITNRAVVDALNDTDPKRAEIVRRYRLFSSQPDEMITFRALAQMQPSRLRLDPRLYQYGGLWTYPIGALLQAAEKCRLVTLSGNLAAYLDQPELFARFYVIARGYSGAWGIVGVCVLFSMARQIGANRGLAALAAMGFALLPAIINGAHEAKPHLAGTTLVLAAALASMRMIERPTAGRWFVVALLAGAAVGMVPTGVAAIVLLPTALWIVGDRGRAFAKRLAFGLAVIAIVYAVTNPFVLVHLFVDRAVLVSNAGNTSAMYGSRAPLAGIVNAVSLLSAAGTIILCLIGLLCWIGLPLIHRLAWRQLAPLAAAGGVTFAVFALFAAGKPGEYGRFFALPAAVLWIGVVAVLAKWRKQSAATAVATLLVLGLIAAAWPYERAFIRDANHIGTRDAVADRFAAVSRVPMTMALRAEPAPYAMPPVDLFQTRLLLIPPNMSAAEIVSQTNAVWLVRAVDTIAAPPPPGWDSHWSTPGGPIITWADKPFDVWRRDR